MRLIGLLLAGMMIVPALSAGLNSANHYLRVHIGEGVAQRLRQELFDHLLHVRLAELEQFTSGEHVYRLTRSCGRIGEVYVSEHLLPLVMNAILLIGTLAAMTALHWRLSLLALLAFPLAYFLTRKTRGRAQSLYRDQSDLLEAGQSYLHQVFPGLRTIRASNAQSHEEGRWREWLTAHRNIKARVATFHELIRIVLPESINQIAAGLVFGYGAFEIIQGRLSIGSLVAFIAYLPRAYAVLQALLSTHVNLQEARINAEKVADIFALPPEPSGHTLLAPGPPIEEEDVEMTSQPVGASLAFQDVSFNYGRGDFGAQELSFSVEPGEFVGIVGPSGGGKSTIIDLIMGFYTPRSGKIMIDGIDLHELSLDSLRSQDWTRLPGYISLERNDN